MLSFNIKKITQIKIEILWVDNLFPEVSKFTILILIFEQVLYNCKYINSLHLHNPNPKLSYQEIKRNNRI
jgi:hypothetical protein